jgi:uncharacterized protein YecE (DUF72 family)
VESLEKVRVVIEFRHAQWINDNTMDLLRELNAGYCIVDMPQVKNLPSSPDRDDFRYCLCPLPRSE